MMPTNSLEMVVLIIEVDKEVNEKADNGIEKELDMNMGHKKLSCHKKLLSDTLSGISVFLPPMRSDNLLLMEKGFPFSEVLKIYTSLYCLLSPVK